jgi:histidinol phosphatase-like PHP family hydrolase
VARYLELGGKRITLASDAHFLHEAGRGMEKAAAVLKEMGVEEAYYLKERKFYAYTL